MSVVEILILAVVQGVTEFLPISSSGHLVIVAELLGGVGARADVNIVLHAGTLLSILVYFRRRVARLVTDDRRVIPLLIIGTLPAAALGLTIRALSPSLLESPLLAGAMLMGTGLLLLAVRWIAPRDGAYRELSPSGGLRVGLFQALALLPGISRSGATIVGGLLEGLDRRQAATFSFLLAIPAIGGASLLEVLRLFNEGNGSASVPALVSGCAVAFLVGLGALAWLFRWLDSGKLHYFAFWCLPVGLGVMIWQLVG